MQRRPDSELLADFVDRGSQHAFAQLVEGHINLVHSAAMRMVRGDRDLAEEVAQVVFIILAKKAKSLRRDVILAAWLHRTTRYTALNILKVRARRQRHERKAAEMFGEFPRTDSSWKWISPLLDEAVAQLSERDRQAILLRYFEQKSVAETGSALGITEDAAGMRISRAVERLRTFFGKKGVSLSALALGGVISANAVHAAPASLAAQVSSSAINVVAGAGAAALGAGSGSMLKIASAVDRAMFLAKAKATAAVFLALLTAGYVTSLFGNEFILPIVKHWSRTIASQPTQTSMLLDPAKRGSAPANVSQSVATAIQLRTDATRAILRAGGDR